MLISNIEVEMYQFMGITCQRFTHPVLMGIGNVKPLADHPAYGKWGKAFI